MRRWSRKCGRIFCVHGVSAAFFHSAEHDHEFNEWYNTEHIPALGSVPGTLCARRYRGMGGTQRYVALYHLTTPDVVRSAEWKKAADTPWTQKMRPHFRDHLRIECRRYTRTQ